MHVGCRGPGLVKTLRSCCCGRFVGRLHCCMHSHRRTPHGRGAARNRLRKPGPERSASCLLWAEGLVAVVSGSGVLRPKRRQYGVQHIANTNRALECHVAIPIDPAVDQWYISSDVPSAVVLKRTYLQCKRDIRFVEFSSSRPAFVQTAPSQTTANPRH
jgi:hypothetical protein